MPDYPDIADHSHATPAAEALFRSYFTAKSNHDVAATMDHFSSEQLTYVDANLGWALNSHAELEAVFAEYMPHWGAGISYPTRIIGDQQSAIVFMTDSPELFGQEIAAIAAVDVRDGKIVRWIDYWDSRQFGSEAAAQLRKPSDEFARDLGEDRIDSVASPKLRGAVEPLVAALSDADAGAAAELFSIDAQLEDMSLRTQIRGRLAIGRYLERALPLLPYGSGVELRHAVGADAGGGFEWTAGDDAGGCWGITSVDLDEDGLVTKMTSVWDGDRLSRDASLALVALSMEPASGS